MNVKRYFAKTSREAMAQIKAELGDDAVVLKTRKVANGVEIMAMADGLALDDEFAQREPSAPASRHQPSVRPSFQQRVAAENEAAAAASQSSAEPATRELPVVSNRSATAKPMSTLSFQQFVRDRLARRSDSRAASREAAEPHLVAPLDVAPTSRAPVALGQANDDEASRIVVAPDVAPMAKPARKSEARAATEPVDLPARRAEPVKTAAPLVMSTTKAPAAARAALHDGSLAPAMSSLTEMLKGEGAGENAEDLMAQLREMRGLISTQLSSLATLNDLQRDPVRTQLLRNLLGYGLSPLLVRKLIARLPSDYGADEAAAWAASSLARLIRVVPQGETLLEKGGIYAMTGPTGVGKTTTTAKLAAQFALRHGASSIGLLTVDAYRIGAQDQLRTFGRLLGVPVHVVHDAASLAEFMNIFMNKKLVLIDTVGVGQRDERVSELLASLASASIKRLLVLNAAAQVETLDDVIGAYRADARTGVIVSKLDEAVKPGGVVDCLIRHRLPLVGMADGQRVPEDWHLPDPAGLIRRAMTRTANPVFDLDDNEMTLLLNAPPVGQPVATGAGARSV